MRFESSTLRLFEPLARLDRQLALTLLVAMPFLGLPRTRTIVSVVSPYRSAFDVVGRVGFQDRYQPFAASRIFDRDQQFHSLVQIARHPVCAGDKRQIIAAVAKVDDAAVFEISIQNADNADVIAQARYVRSQTANAPYVQVDLHACLRRLVQ